MADESFPRINRIAQRADFITVYERGRRVHGRCVVVFCLERAEGEAWRVGITATRKTTGKAVTRNRLRRRVREFFRRRRGLLPPAVDFVINLKRAAIEAEFEEFEQDLSRVLRKLGYETDPPQGAKAAHVSRDA